MAVLTGADGRILVGSNQIAKARDYTISVSKDALEDTSLGDYDRTYVEGLRGATGSMTILYDPNLGPSSDLLNSILETKGVSQNVTFVFVDKGNKQIKCSGFITSVSQSVSVGAVQAASCNFQISGAVDSNGRF